MPASAWRTKPGSPKLWVFGGSGRPLSGVPRPDWGNIPGGGEFHFFSKGAWDLSLRRPIFWLVIGDALRGNEFHFVVICSNTCTCPLKLKSKGIGLRRTLSNSLYFTCFLLAALIFTGCGGYAAKRAGPHPEGKQFVARGNVSYSRMKLPLAWEAYSRAEALGVQDGIVSYRLDLLREILNKSFPGGSGVHRRKTLIRLENAYRKSSKNPLVYFYLGLALAAAGDNGTRKARLYAEGVQKYESGKFGSLGMDGFEALGRMYLFLGQPDKAEKLFLKAQAIDSQHALSAYNLLRLYQQAEHYEKAIVQMRRFVRIAPRDTEGHTLLGESAFGGGRFEQSVKSFETALSLDSANGRARAGLRRAREIIERRDKLAKGGVSVVWDAGYITRMRPLTLPEDNLNLNGKAVGPPDVGPKGELVVASGDGQKFGLYTLSPDGLRLTRRAASSSGFASFINGPHFLMVTLGSGPGRELGAYDLRRGTFRAFYRGNCQQPRYSGGARAVLCGGPQGLQLVDPVAGGVSTLYREPETRHARLSRDGRWAVMAEGDALVWLERSGQVAGRHRFGGRRRASPTSPPAAAGPFRARMDSILPRCGRIPPSR